MEAKTIHCPGCGKSASGKFCSHCGAPIVATCPSCGADVKPGSRACHACGASFTAVVPNQSSKVQTIVPWVAIGLAAFALVFSLMSWFDRGGNDVPPVPVRFSQSAPSALSAPGQPPDLSSMSPREAADRLYNRVMTASENGDTQEALRFAPMAIQAYDRAGPLDNDARYHVALIHMVTGNTKKARAQIDLLRKVAPNHLLGFMLEHQIAAKSGDQNGVARANKGFLAAYDAEIAMGRGEYQDHRSSIERFHQAAQAVTAGKK
jgi:hypothetical protein